MGKSDHSILHFSNRFLLLNECLTIFSILPVALCEPLVLQGPHTKGHRVHSHVFLALLTVYLVVNVCKITPFACVHSLLENYCLTYVLLQNIPYALNLGIKNGPYC